MSPRVWCPHLKGPCAADCYGSECLMRQATESPITEPGALSPLREVRMPPGTGIVLALAFGGLLGAVVAWNWVL